MLKYAGVALLLALTACAGRGTSQSAQEAALEHQACRSWGSPGSWEHQECLRRFDAQRANDAAKRAAPASQATRDDCLAWGPYGSAAFGHCKATQAQLEESRRQDRRDMVNRAFEQNRSQTTVCMPFAGRVVCNTN